MSPQGIDKPLNQDPLVRGDPDEDVGCIVPYAVDLTQARVDDNELGDTEELASDVQDV